MTVDVEDYFQVSGFAAQIRPSDWGSYESRVVANTHRLLRLLGRHEITATFFILGWVAERYPHLVSDIKNDGHEIAYHSYQHQLVYDLTPEEFRADLIRGRSLLEDLTGGPVTMYRAPSFSITERSLWAYEILAEEGFLVDSSVFPIHHDRYGIPDAHPFPHAVTTASGPVWEFPASVHRVLKANLPISGGGYFRFYPRWVSELGFRRINEHFGRPFMFYVHPWEIDPDQPRLPGPMRSRLRHYMNLSANESKLDRILPKFRFSSMSAALDADRALVQLHCPAGGVPSEASQNLTDSVAAAPANSF